MLYNFPKINFFIVYFSYPEVLCGGALEWRLFKYTALKHSYSRIYLSAIRYIINCVLLSVWNTCKLTDIVMYTTLVISVESSVSPFCSYQRCVAQLFAHTKQRFRYYDAFLSQLARVIRNVGSPSHFTLFLCRADVIRAFTDLIDRSEDFKSLLIVPSLLIEGGTSLVSSFVG